MKLHDSRQISVQRINRVIDLISENIDEPLPLERHARLADFSPCYSSKLTCFPHYRLERKGMASAVVSRLRLVVLGGEPARELRPPLRGLLGLAPLVVKPHGPLAGFGQMALERWRDGTRALLHPLVACNQERLGLVELLLAQQALPEQALAVEP